MKFIVRGLLLMSMLMLHPDGEAGAGGEPNPPEDKPKEKKPKEDSNIELAKALKELRENSVSKED